MHGPVRKKAFGNDVHQQCFGSRTYVRSRIQIQPHLGTHAESNSSRELAINVDDYISEDAVTWKAENKLHHFNFYN